MTFPVFADEQITTKVCVTDLLDKLRQPVIPGGKRTILIEKYLPDAGNTDPSAFIDYNHTRMVTQMQGIYTREDANRLDRNNVKYLIDLIGIDVTKGVYNQFTSGYDAQDGTWMFYPVQLLDYDDKVIMDDPYQSKTLSRKWFHADAGNLIVFLKDGPFTGGSLAGKTHFAGSGFIYEYMDLLKAGGNWKNACDRDQLFCTTPHSASQYPNMYITPNETGYVDSIIRWECIDENGAKLRGMSTNTYYPVNGIKAEYKQTMLRGV